MMRRKKNVKKGIQFCLMVCGASGTGTILTSRRVQAYSIPVASICTTQNGIL